MATGKRLLKQVDRGGYMLAQTRNWNERNFDSDRNKGIRRAITKKCRTLLKRELNVELENLNISL